MDNLLIEGVKPYDGRYEFDMTGQPFTVREWGWIKRHSGYLPLTLFDGWKASDAELMAVFAIIALVRAGKLARDDVPQAWERFSDAPGVVTVRLELEDTVEDEPDPPLSPPSSSSNGGTSGDDTKTSSGSPDPGLKPSGILASDTSVSGPARLAT